MGMSKGAHIMAFKLGTSRMASRGFSLIELSIVLAVIGIMLALALPLGTAQMNVKKYGSTADKLDVIQDALNLHAKLNGGLPCPASKTSLPDTVDFGMATDCTAAAAPGTLETGSSPSLVRVGAVPARTLNLPERMMFDAWGRRFTYAVTRAAVGSSLSAGVITVVDANGNGITTPPSSAAYVVFSSGAEGKGTHLRHGVATSACGSSTKDSENCDNNTTFRDMALNNGAADAGFYDDVLRWSTADTINDAIGATAGGGAPGGGAPTGPEREWEEDWSSFRGLHVTKVNSRASGGYGDTCPPYIPYHFFAFDPENARMNCLDSCRSSPAADDNRYCTTIRIPDDVSLIEVTVPSRLSAPPGFWSPGGYGKHVVSIPPGSRVIDLNSTETQKFFQGYLGVRIRFIK